ncbi:MAG: substrate-binding domain-containing protein [Thermodesulfovibrionales bacterium]
MRKEYKMRKEKNKKPICLLFLYLILALTLEIFVFDGFLSLNAADMSDLTYQGTHILTYGALDELSRVFEKRYGKRVFIKGGGCTDGIVAVTKKGFDMGGVCCPLNQNVQKQDNLIPHRVAIDIKAVIVNPSNLIGNITMKELSEIHSGSISNWRSIGGADRPIALIYRDHCRDMSEPVRDILGIKRLSGKAIVVQTDKEVIEYVERFPAAIGVTSRIFAEGAKVKIIKVDGIDPTPENTEKGLYRLRGDLYLVTKGRPSGWTKTFLEFVLSPEGQTIIGKKFGRVR